MGSVSHVKIKRKEWSHIKMKIVAQFEKVTLNQFMQDWLNTIGGGSAAEMTTIYNNIKLPERQTEYSAGHDFYIPDDFCIEPGNRAMIPTGIKCTMNTDFVMLIFPRSSLGIKKHISMANAVAVIDADYAFADNEGHIFICIENRGTESIQLKAGEAFVQAVFVEYGVAGSVDVKKKRRGGIGSTGNR